MALFASPASQGTILEELADLTLEDLCRACDAHADLVAELVEESAIVPLGHGRPSWRFAGVHLRHARVAVRLQRDLGVNAAGAALALQLMDELERLRERVRGLGGSV